ncbi:MAG: polymorphic toxin type 10 domain-containing protein [Hormoscilla sp.]
MNNPIPQTLARVMPDNINPQTLGSPRATDVFVTAAEDIQGLNAAQIAEKLTIPPSLTDRFLVMEFPSSSVTNIASPVNRNNPGFVGKGQTAGGAREFVIPNGTIPQEATFRIVE